MTIAETTVPNQIDRMAELLLEVERLTAVANDPDTSDPVCEDAVARVLELDDQIAGCRATTVEGAELAYRRLVQEWQAHWVGFGTPGEGVISALIQSIAPAIGVRRAEAVRPARTARARAPRVPASDRHPGDLLTSGEAAARMRVSTKTLERWRSEGTGPVYSKLGGLVLYSPAVLDEFIAARSRKATRDPAGRGRS